MKKIRNRYDNIIAFILSASLILAIDNLNRWYEHFLYGFATLLALYSYIVAISIAISFLIYSVWSIIHNIRLAYKLKIENLEMIKSLTATMNDISSGKFSSHIDTPIK
jgi:hypothetical protein